MSAPVDVRGVIRATVESLRDSGDTGMVQNLLDADAAVAELIKATEELLPRNVCLGNTNVPDSTTIPLTATLGELRRAASALDRVRGAA